MRVLTIGTFDMFHRGHLRFLEACSKLGELHVGVNSDEHVKQFKREPVMSWTERLEVIAGIKAVTGGSFGYDGDFKRVIDLTKPDILAIGYDWAGGTRYIDHLGITQEWLDDCGITLVFVYTPTMSTTEIIERVRSRG